MTSVLSWLWKRNLTPYLFILPAFLFIFVFMIYPIFDSLWLSLTDYEYPGLPYKFIGLRNYFELATDEGYITALKNTMELSIIYFPLVIVLSLLLGSLLARNMKGISFFRISVFLPVAVPLSLAAVMWQIMFSYSYGPINNILKLIGLGHFQQNWLGSTTWALYAVIIVNIWKRMGLDTIIFLGGIQNIPKQLYESAAIDGANAFQSFLHITIPQLKSSFLIVGFLELIGAIKIFVPVWVMTGGGPASRTEVLYSYAYRQAFRYTELGYASTIAYTAGAIIVLFSLIQRRLLLED